MVSRPHAEHGGGGCGEMSTVSGDSYHCSHDSSAPVASSSDCACVPPRARPLSRRAFIGAFPCHHGDDVIHNDVLLLGGRIQQDAID